MTRCQPVDAFSGEESRYRYGVRRQLTKRRFGRGALKSLATGLRPLVEIKSEAVSNLEELVKSTS